MSEKVLRNCIIIYLLKIGYEYIQIYDLNEILYIGLAMLPS